MILWIDVLNAFMVQDPHDHDTCLHDPGDHPVPVGEPASLSVGDRTLDVAAAMCQAMGDAPRLRLLLWLCCCCF